MHSMVEHQAGAMVFHRDPVSGILIAMLCDNVGRATLPKGRIEAGEDEVACMLREVHEELGLKVTPIAMLGATEISSRHPAKGHITKVIAYYLAQADSTSMPSMMRQRGLIAARWFQPSEISSVRTYPEVREILRKGLQVLGYDQTAISAMDK